MNATEVEALRVPLGSTSHQAAKDPADEIGTAAHPRPSRRIYRELTCLRHPQPQQHSNNNSSLRCLIPTHSNSFVLAVQSSPSAVIHTKAVNPSSSLTTSSSEFTHSVLQTNFHTRYRATAVKSHCAHTQCPSSTSLVTIRKTRQVSAHTFFHKKSSTFPSHAFMMMSHIIAIEGLSGYHPTAYHRQVPY